MFKIPKINIKVSYDKRIKNTVQIKSLIDLHRLCIDIFNKDTFDWTEELIMLCINSRGIVVGYYKLSNGGMSASICDQKVIFTIALNSLATQIILIHNHPSGNPNPSRTDIEIFKRLIKAGNLLTINVVESAVITKRTIYSMAHKKCYNL